MPLPRTRCVHAHGLSVPDRTSSRRLSTITITIAIAFVGSLLVGIVPVTAAADSATITGRIYSSADEPRTKAASSKRSVNLGVKFRSSQAGAVTALQFYRGPRQKKAYRGSLWSSKGKLLARVTFPKSSTTGWQSAELSKPLPIKKSTTYVVSYLASDGRYPVTRGRFATAYSHDGLTVPKKGGVYKHSKSNKFPTHAVTSSYLIDVVFVPSQSVVSDTAALVAVSKARVFFGHQSVGGNIIGGLSAAFTSAGVSAPPFVDSRVAPSTTSPVFLHAYIGANGDPLGKMHDFASLLNGGIGTNVDVALMKLCFVDIVGHTDTNAVFAEYTATMSALEKAHPGVTFLYTTEPLTTENGAQAVDPAAIDQLTGTGIPQSDNVARERYNALVRARYAGTGRLLDIAALEAQRDYGKVMAGSIDGKDYYVMNPDLSSDGGHLNDKGSRKVALALAHLIANLNG